jgi:hypothetical protein
MDGLKKMKFIDSEIFSKLNQQEIKKINKSITHKSLKKGDYLFHEGDDSNDIFFLEEGNLEVIKTSYDKKKEFQVNILNPGAIIGEMALVDRQPRSATIRALDDSLVSKLPFNVITRSEGTEEENKSELDHHTVIPNSIFSKVSIYILRTISERLRLRTESTVQALQKQVEEEQKRSKLGSFIITTLILLSLYTILLSAISYIVDDFLDNFIISLSLIFIIAVSIALRIKLLKEKLSDYGLTLKTWKNAMADFVIFTVAIMIIATLFKWFLVHHTAIFKDQNIFVFYSDPRMPALLEMFLYMSFAPVQEFIVRGTLQSAFERFLIIRHRVIIAILLSNMLFAVFHSHYTPVMSLIVLIPGVIWGWMYSRTKTIVGVSLSHAIVGYYFFNTLGCITMFI